ncbi:glucose-1-phosphate cytidylyltransferase [Xenococcus sp. PCC 7305]|uniref:glucose-1-phosphate cytidylyltransferase n=1 Tax=Xenococcus sp. PCC 7305 TaxID=102125 RepID=UPI0002AC50EC|nr:glucose-1-phosphate cytidylyltransferase [Xenococcus sp. PCC 7305]ELS02146.1 glucose-1-phosphate cytidylyltransferase [Xenococcus sp. PCC 7305]
MKVGMLAGGLGTRISEETVDKPKPMVEIGTQPIMWHIMKHYYHYDLSDFVIALGYKGHVIKKYFSDYCALNSNLTVELRNGKITAHSDGTVDDWTVQLIDTGLSTNTGGRIKRLIPYLSGAKKGQAYGKETFMMTWGDGVSNIDLKKLLAFHNHHKEEYGTLATLTAVRPPARFGHLEFSGERIAKFSEKPQTAEGWINGAFFVLEPEVFEYIDGDATLFEKEPLEGLAADGKLMAYKHEGFWQCMDTLRDKKRLEKMWETGNAPWKTWSDTLQLV